MALDWVDFSELSVKRGRIKGETKGWNGYLPVWRAFQKFLSLSGERFYVMFLFFLWVGISNEKLSRSP